MDISDFDVILSMDWLMAHRVVIDCDCRRIFTYTRDDIRVTFQGDKHDVLPPNWTRLQVAWTVDGLTGKPYPIGQGETTFESNSGGL